MRWTAPVAQSSRRRCALMPRFGTPPIAADDLARITVPTSLIWDRHDLQTRLRTAEAAAARLGWPLHVVDDDADDPAHEQPAAFLDALRTALAREELAP